MNKPCYLQPTAPNANDSTGHANCSNLHDRFPAARKPMTLFPLLSYWIDTYCRPPIRPAEGLYFFPGYVVIQRRRGYASQAVIIIPHLYQHSSVPPGLD